MEYENKEVYFDKYCPECKYKNFPEDAMPCTDCLASPCALNSHKPIKFVERNKR